MTTTAPARDGVTADDAERALAAMELELGSEAVTRLDSMRVLFDDPYRTPSGRAPSSAGVVMPVSTDEVRRVVQIASRFSVPLWTSSQARNYGYGGAEPRVDGSIALSFKRMNRVLEINAESGFAVVEPGVTFAELYEAVRASGAPYWISCPDLGWGSVVGNALEHGLGYTPMGDHAASICGMEVVLANGDVVRTGMGGIPGSQNWHTYRRGFGPSLDGLFTQSNLGIVTQVGIWLMPEPQCYAPGAIIVPNEDDLEVLVDTLRPLVMDGTIQGFPMIAHGMGPLVMAIPRPAWPQMRGIGTQADLQPLTDAMGLGMWITRLALYGRTEAVAANRAHIKRAIATIPGARIEFREYEAPYEPDDVAPLDQVPAGIPNMQVLDFLNAFGGPEDGGHMDFSPVTPMTGRHAMTVFRTIREHYARHDIKAVYTPILRERSLIHVNMIGFNKRDADEVRNAHDTVRELVDAMDGLGYTEYRAHQDFVDQIAGKYTFGDSALPRLHQTLKDALDPAGILSPGKQGVWPSRTPGPA